MDSTLDSWTEGMTDEAKAFWRSQARLPYAGAVMFTDEHAADPHTHEADGTFLYEKAPTILPKQVFEVTYSEIDDERQDSIWYDKAKAEARTEELNREIWQEERKSAEQTRERFVPVRDAIEAEDGEELAFLDAQWIAASARDRKVRKEAAEVRNQFHRMAVGDARYAIEWADDLLALSFEGWLLVDNRTRAVWRVGEWDVADA